MTGSDDLFMRPGEGERVDKKATKVNLFLIWIVFLYFLGKTDYDLYTKLSVFMGLVLINWLVQGLKNEIHHGLYDIRLYSRLNYLSLPEKSKLKATKIAEEVALQSKFDESAEEYGIIHKPDGFLFTLLSSLYYALYLGLGIALVYYLSEYS